MASQALSATDVNEQALLSLVRKLPPERRAQVLDFARFLEAQTAASDGGFDDEETAEEIAASNERWDALLASDASQSLLETMAAEALTEINAGHARPMTLS
jgi:hypothetical protein